MAEDERITAAGRAGAGGQNSHWLLREVEPATPVHSIAATARFPGGPDLRAMRYAVGALAAGHTALRMSFPRGGEPVQWAARIAAACVRANDLRDLDRERFAALLERAVSEPFDLARGPRLRVRLYHRADQETVVLVTAHHFVADICSMTTLTRELDALYAARAGAVTAEPVRLYRWVGGRRSSAHAVKDDGAGVAPGVTPADG